MAIKMIVGDRADKPHWIWELSDKELEEHLKELCQEEIKITDTAGSGSDFGKPRRN